MPAHALEMRVFVRRGWLFVIPRSFRRTTTEITWSTARHQQLLGRNALLLWTRRVDIEQDDDVSATVRLRRIVHRLQNENGSLGEGHVRYGPRDSPERYYAAAAVC
jgi:hypothetical protein